MDMIPHELKLLLRRQSDEKNLIDIFCFLIREGVSFSDIFGEDIELINEKLNKKYGKIILRRKGMNIQTLNELFRYLKKEASEMKRKMRK